MVAKTLNIGYNLKKNLRKLPVRHFFVLAVILGGLGLFGIVKVGGVSLVHGGTQMIMALDSVASSLLSQGAEAPAGLQTVSARLISLFKYVLIVTTILSLLGGFLWYLLKTDRSDQAKAQIGKAVAVLIVLQLLLQLLLWLTT